MKKIFLIPIIAFCLSLVLSLSTCAMAEASNKWLIKSKSDNGSGTLFAIWQDGSITAGEPYSLTGSDEIVEVERLQAKQFVQAKQWFSSGGGKMYTPWQGKPITYAVESLGGKCRIGLSAKNFVSQEGWGLPKKYNNFKLLVKIDDKKAGKIYVGASNAEVKTGYLTLENVPQGNHQLEFTWKNDRYKPNKRIDTNLEIHNVTFEKFK